MNFIHTYRQQLKIFFIFIFGALGIILLHLRLHPLRVLDMDTSIFYMDEKYTLAAFFSTVTAFLLGSIALANLAPAKTGLKKLADTAYGLFFIILAIDEYFEIHEYANTLVKQNFKNHGILTTLSNLSWIFPLFLIILAVFALLAIKFKKAESDVRIPLLAGSFCFALVLVFELLGSSTYGQKIYLYYVAIEEGLEMIGISFFLLATLIQRRSLKN